jgi:hypothetical protein
MPRPGFYNDNEYRWYPFIYRKTTAENIVPHAAIVDCGIIMGLDSRYDAATHTVWLAHIRRAETVIEFEVRTDAPGVTGPLTFTRDATILPGQEAYVEPEPGNEWQTEYVSGPVGEEVCAIEPSWEGFLVTGPLKELIDSMAIGETREFGSAEYVVEPGRVQSLVKSYLRSITVGNMARPEAKSSCDPENTLIRPVIINSRCIAGDIRFKEGYNAIIAQSDSENKISVGAGRGSGAPIDGDLCENGSEIPFYPGEAPPEGSQFFSGGPACDELISSINGVQGPDVTIVGGTGISLVPDEAPNTLRISLSNVNLAGNC